MSFTCIICSDILNPTIDIYATTCEHIFHHICLIQWLQRSKSCPQCRFKVTEKDIIRLYVTTLNTWGIVEDAGALQLGLDNALFQLKLKELDNKKNDEKMLMEKKRSELLRSEMQQLESEKVTYESVNRSLKEQVQYLKTKVRDFDKVREENKTLSIKIKDLQNIDLLISGSKDQVSEMLKYDHDPKALSLMVQTLKKLKLAQKNLNETYTPATKSSSAGLSCIMSPIIGKPNEPVKKTIGQLLLPKSTKPLNHDYHYDGLGGHNKDVRFPEPHLSRPSPGISGFKRHQSAMKSINKHKVRKISSKSVGDYFNKRCDDEDAV